MGGNMQPQGQVQILVNLIDRGFDLQQALDAPRVRALDGRRVSVEVHANLRVADELSALGHEIVEGEALPHDWTGRHEFMRSFAGCAQAIALQGEALCGASDPRLDGIAAPL
jgi:gamma-glutamyltranspeptidase/glutathione hydrolase